MVRADIINENFGYILCVVYAIVMFQNGQCMYDQLCLQKAIQPKCELQHHGESMTAPPPGSSPNSILPDTFMLLLSKKKIKLACFSKNVISPDICMYL